MSLPTIAGGNPSRPKPYLTNDNPPRLNLKKQLTNIPKRSNQYQEKKEKKKFKLIFFFYPLTTFLAIKQSLKHLN